MTEKDATRITFKKGDNVVYPNHGAGCVAGIEKKTVQGEERSYYIVYIPDSELTLSIPVDGDTGLRPCSDKESTERALATLSDEVTEMPANWNQRLKHNREKLRDGDIAEVAEVVRNLSVFGGENGLSTGERGMLSKARQILVSEIALVRDVGVTEAETMIETALENGKGDE
jgi:CarD family transcriptional regulator